MGEESFAVKYCDVEDLALFCKLTQLGRRVIPENLSSERIMLQVERRKLSD